MCGSIVVNLFGGSGSEVGQVGCVYADECGAVGRYSGNDWGIFCWDTDPNPEPLPDVSAYLANIENTITVDREGAWDEVYNMKIPSIDNYQTGWWIRDDDTVAEGSGIYTETDKPVNNVCTA